MSTMIDDRIQTDQQVMLPQPVEQAAAQPADYIADQDAFDKFNPKMDTSQLRALPIEERRFAAEAVYGKNTAPNPDTLPKDARHAIEEKHFPSDGEITEEKYKAATELNTIIGGMSAIAASDKKPVDTRERVNLFNKSEDSTVVQEPKV